MSENNVRVFTDDDLKRFKHMLSSGTTEPADAFDEMKALIRRLECAENIVSLVSKKCPWCSDIENHTLGCPYKTAFFVWRKSKGE